MNRSLQCPRLPPFFVALLFLVTCLPLAAEDVSLEVSFEPGVRSRTPDALEEAFRLPENLTAALESATMGDRLLLSEFPVAIGSRQPVTLERVAIYSERARIVVVDRAGEREVPRDARRYFRGRTNDGAIRFGVAFDPATDRMRGLVMDGGSIVEFNERSGGDASRHALRESVVVSDGLEYECGTDPIDSRDLDNPFAGSIDPPPAPNQRGAAPGMREVEVAVDVDDEMMSKRFSDSEAAATAWLADMFLQMNVLYERDLDLHLAQGETFLRLTDSYSTTSSDSTYAQLLELGNYWAANHGDVSRTFVMQISGKQESAYGASGIAWLDAFCEKQSYGGGYSVNRVFWNPAISIASSLKITAHELGHNLGSPHTHCYPTPIDQCFAGEGGCYGGATSCPSGGAGTLMSYCHLTGCGSTANLHPTVVSHLTSRLDAHYPSCVKDFGASGQLFADGLETGNTNAWDTELP